jgi:hypothetical protein
VTTSTVAVAALVAGVVAVLGVGEWVGTLMVTGIVALAVTVVAAYVLSRP